MPLVKKLCENAMKMDDSVVCIIAQEFGKLVLGLESKIFCFLLNFYSRIHSKVISIKCFRMFITHGKDMVFKIFSTTCTNGYCFNEKRVQTSSSVCEYI